MNPCQKIDELNTFKSNTSKSKSKLFQSNKFGQDLPSDWPSDWSSDLPQDLPSDLSSNWPPDWTPDFSEHINIESNSVGLALDILNMSMGEYNSLDIQKLKLIRKYNSSKSSTYALNILVYYKQNSKTFFPQPTPIQHKINWNIPYIEKGSMSKTDMKDQLFD